MIVQCEVCQMNYNDADRWTLCPHPKLDDWAAREQIQTHRKEQENLQQVQAALGTSQAIADYEKSIVNEVSTKVGLHEKKNLCGLNREQLVKLCDCLGLSEIHKTQRIILDVDCEGFVRIYTKATMQGKQFDVFNFLLSEEN